jgi:dipeptidyl aminopeptidase/acylaminoacyl peptidase
VTRISRHEAILSGFAYAANGTLATLRTDDANPFGGRHVRFWIDGDCVTGDLDRTSAHVVLVDTAPGREAPDPVWADGQVYFEVADRGSIHVYRARPGGRPERVVGGQRVVTGLSVGGGLLAFTSSSPEDPMSLRVADLDGGRERVLFDPNPWLLQERSLGSLRHIEVQHDGTGADGWALLPPGHEEGRRVPTLLYIHGGPHAAYGWSFHLVFQILAGAGYAVVFCNPPGSQSYSEQFARCLRGAWGEMDFPYFMALVDSAVEAGFADPERLGVGGASYGGYSTLWTITHTDRFKAAVSMRPVSNLLGFYGSSDIGWNFGAASLGAEPWEDPELYQRLSPVSYADRVTTPLRLIGGTADLRTPVEQAENMFVRLRKLGRPVDLVIFSGESHAMVVQGKPWNRVRHMEAVLEWFDRYLEPSA